MQHLSTIPGAIIGWTSRGPIRVQAGGSEPAPEVTPPAEPPTDPAVDPAQETDWVAEARKWEKRAKENSKAAEELEKHKTASMTETEKAVEKARKEGESTAAVTYGKQVAEAKFEAALALKGLALDDFRELIDFGKFVTDKGETDTEAIKKAVTKLSKLATPKTPGVSGGDFSGSGGNGQGPTLDEQIVAAEKAGNHRLAITLKRQKAALT